MNENICGHQKFKFHIFKAYYFKLNKNNTKREFLHLIEWEEDFKQKKAEKSFRTEVKHQTYQDTIQYFSPT